MCKYAVLPYHPTLACSEMSVAPFSQYAFAKKEVHLPLQECAMGTGPARDLPLLCGEEAGGPRHANL